MSEHDQPVAANLLDRRFQAPGPNQRWVGDTTEFVIGCSGKLYLAAVLDLFSRFVVGWAVSAVNDRHLAIRALAMALKRRCPDAVSCITPSKAARTPPRITKRSSRRVASPAA
jgi:putative transposase